MTGSFNLPPPAVSSGETGDSNIPPGGNIVWQAVPPLVLMCLIAGEDDPTLCRCVCTLYSDCTVTVQAASAALDSSVV